MSGNRIIAILVGFALLFVLQFKFDAAWYIYLPVGTVGYLLARYAGWAVEERRRFKREMAETVEKARRGEPL